MTISMNRRRFALTALLGTTAAVALRAAPALAQDRPAQIVLANWGGDALDAYAAAYGNDYEAETGIKLVQDGGGPTEGAIAAQAQSGAPSWDILDVDSFSAAVLGKQGYLEPIDYSIVDKTKVREGGAWEYGVAGYALSYILVYDAKKYGDNPPQTMADFFDVEAFPGKRTMYKWGVGSWEAALLADGVAVEDLYPLDLDRAHAKIRELMPHIVSFWGNGSESQQIMLDGEASMGLLWNTRAALIDRDTGGDVTFTYNEGLISTGCFGVMKNPPAGVEEVMKFIAFCQEPERQVIMFKMLNQGPANPAADALIPEDMRRFNCVDPENVAVQFNQNMEWYEENYTTALDEYLKVISS